MARHYYHNPILTETTHNALSDLGRSSFSKKTIYGVNSTFSSDGAIKSDIYQLPRKAETSASLNSSTSQRLFERCDSSDSGSESLGGTVYSKDTSINSPKMTVSGSIADSKLDYETWPEMSVVFPDNEDAINGNKENLLSDMCYQIREDLLDHERSAARDFRLVCEILTRLVEWQLSEGINDADFGPIRVALEKIARFADNTRKQREAITEFVALLQLEFDTATQGLLTQPNRVEDGDSYDVIGERDDAFTLHLGKKSIVLTSPTKDQWIEDISSAVKHDVKNRLDLPPILSENEQRISMGGCDVAVDETQPKERRKLSPLQVCWYRKTSLSIRQIYNIVDVCQSGYLLRKLRNSNGWQRLWTELTSHTLFFYKTHKDTAPLANLPLLEYKLCMPSVVDRVHHSNCFKLVYSTHEYFFRTSGSYSFHRWTEALRKAAISQVVPDVVTALSLRI
ncbi:PH domain protein [Teladorsagia circumcincta]|uniref:PH domain protein n=1 Tax=Teladorsagia circumcincta TaxID=45464 RepID=A0A2G9URN0_TELCI|nr:PH domain protein [Teladorsagia circumcincta]